MLQTSGSSAQQIWRFSMAQKANWRPRSLTRIPLIFANKPRRPGILASSVMKNAVAHAVAIVHRVRALPASDQFVASECLTGCSAT
jgi:hypothetical protein